MTADTKNFDPVNGPEHYRTGSIECIDYIKDNLSHEAFLGYLEGNVKKYLHRWRHKNGTQDIDKAMWYLSRLQMELATKGKPPMLQSLKSIFAPIINKYHAPPPPAKSDKKRGWKQKGHWRKINGKHVWCGGKTN